MSVDGPLKPDGDLHVLLRHRLLREAEVENGKCVVEVDDKPRHPAAVDLKQVADRPLLELGSADPPTAGVLHDREDPRVVYGFVFEGVRAKPDPVSQPLAPPVVHGVEAMPGFRFGAASKAELDQWVGPVAPA